MGSNPIGPTSPHKRKVRKYSMSEKALQELYDKYQKDERFNHLHVSNFVPGIGKIPSDILIIGEAPGKVENSRREPFRGDSGKLLRELLVEGGITESDFFVTNVLKYRPPQNRTPRESEILAAISYLREEIKIVNPKVIILLGKVPTRSIFPGRPFKSLLWKMEKTKKYTIIILNHPAFILYAEDETFANNIKKQYIATFKSVRQLMNENGSE